MFGLDLSQIQQVNSRGLFLLNFVLNDLISNFLIFGGAA